MKKRVLLLSVLLTSCATTKPETTLLGKGTVQSEVQLESKSDIEKSDALKGAGVGAGVGAVGGAGVGAAGGAVFGGLIGALFGGICTVATLGIGFAPCMAAGIGGGAAIGAGTGAVGGAVVGATGGALVGAGGGYVYVANKDDLIGKYKYDVLQEGKSDPIIFEEYPSQNFPEGTKVNIYDTEYKGEHTYHIEGIQDKETTNKDESVSSESSDK
ncbi:hypothetical protein [Francisella frigiditurris]|uniref:Glycine zipper family protein n=1 Tax=Francisella frigiditurris TaxID=1542390 RepID=A0A1J0KUI8_9GAMM|nr:hypothetical protein [Francisella frigiditurris]APC97310.1 hypothetical protein KX01_535 [Francisella frigiditurris]